MALLGSTSWLPSREFLLEHFTEPAVRPPKLENIPRGLDNAHIDVLLAPALRKAVNDLVQDHVHKHLIRLHIKENPGGLLLESEVAFEKNHYTITLAAAQSARKSRGYENLQLYHLAVVKYILLQVENELERVRVELKSISTDVPGTPEHARHLLRDKLEVLKQQQGVIRFAVCKELMQVMNRIESGKLRKVRKSIVGASWPVNPAILFNPLLQLGGLDNKASFLTVYPLLVVRPEALKALNETIVSTFSRWLPVYLADSPGQMVQQDYKSLPIRRDKGELSGYVQVEEALRSIMSPAEYRELKQCWLDEPMNLLQLLGGDDDDWPREGAWRHKSWSAFQRSMVSRLEQSLRNKGFLEDIYASVVITGLVKQVNLNPVIHLAYEYLLGKRDRNALQQSLRSLRTKSNPDRILDLLDKGRKEVVQLAAGKNAHVLVGVIHGYARFRRDLKLAWEAYRNLDMIRLLDNDEDIRLSRSNALLQEFSAEVTQGEESVAGHVIIKADLRGSTALTAGMLEKDLNPAAYFSQNLFDPINLLLDKYGAIKVFVEGDAVILMLLEYSGQQDGMVIARACGLAFRILQVVNSRNAENRHLGLPELELGIGIAYINEAPTYLFDEGRKITISPAINRADRLSSCAPGLHAKKLGANESGWGVEVVCTADQITGLSELDTLQRYNVNGIELDIPAFAKLSREMILKKVKASSLGGQEGDRYYVGRFPDLSGITEWLIIRESLVKHWNGVRTGEPIKSGLKFYEVVTDEKLVARLRSKLAPGRQHETGGVPSRLTSAD